MWFLVGRAGRAMAEPQLCSLLLLLLLAALSALTHHELFSPCSLPLESMRSATVELDVVKCRRRRGLKHTNIHCAHP